MKLIPLTKGKYAMVDDEDYEYLIQWKWTFSDGYGYRLKMNKKIWLHRLVNGTPEGLYTDHINGDRLDNRRANLRVCTYAQNNKNAKTRKDNKSGFRGVHWEKSVGKWRSAITADNKRICLGFYYSPEEAAAIYNEAALKYHGEFARINILASAR